MRALPVVIAVLLLVAPIAGAIAPAAVGGVGATDGSDTAAAASDTPETAVADVPMDASRADPARIDPSGAASGSPAQASGSPAQIDRSEIDEANRTFRTLSTPPDATPRVGITTRGANLGSSLSFAVDETDAAMETAAVVQRIESAQTNTQRQQEILSAINRVERDEVSLNQRQADAFDAHAAGELTDRELLDELIRISATAREYDERLDELSALANETDGISSPGRLDELQVALQVYEGPVRDHALSAARGEIAASEIHVESSEGAVVLATIADGQYVREAFRTDRWDRGGGEISNDAAINATTNAYPETAALREPDAFGAGSVQRITIPHEFGTLRAFVSGGTERVFVEHQRIDLETFPDTETDSGSGDGFNVTVERTYPGGPVAVTVLDDEDREPIDGVTVTKTVGDGDSQPIGTTNADGVVRTLSPADTYRITVVDEPRVVVVDGLEPIATPRLTDDE